MKIEIRWLVVTNHFKGCDSYSLIMFSNGAIPVENFQSDDYQKLQNIADELNKEHGSKTLDTDFLKDFLGDLK